MTGQRIDLEKALVWANEGEFHHVFPKAYLRRQDVSPEKINCLASKPSVTGGPMPNSADLFSRGRLWAKRGIGLRRHPRSRGSFCVSCLPPPMTLGLFRRVLILSTPGPQLYALTSHGAWGSRPRVASRRGRTVGLMAGVAMAIHGCAEGLNKQPEIDRLTEALQRLKQKLRYQERQAIEGLFGSATPSATRPIRANTPSPRPPSGKEHGRGTPGLGDQPWTCVTPSGSRTSRPPSAPAAPTATRSGKTKGLTAGLSSQVTP